MPVAQRHRQCAIYTRPDVRPNDSGQVTIYVEFDNVTNRLNLLLSEINNDSRGPESDWSKIAARVKVALQRMLSRYDCKSRSSATKYFELEFDVNADGVDDAKLAIFRRLNEFGVNVEIITPN